MSGHPAHVIRALVGATVISATGDRPIDDGVVLLEGSRIVAVGSRPTVPVPSEADVVDLGGSFVLPGLIDGNVHLVPWPGWNYAEFLARYEDRLDEIAVEAAQVLLASGFTTVFDTMGPLDALLAARDRSDSGAVTAARIRVAGNIVGFRAVFITPEAIASTTRGLQDRMNRRFEAGGGPDLCWKTPAQIYEQMTRYVEQGVDFVKYGATGDDAPLNSSIGQWAVLRFSPDQQRAIVEAVHAAGKTVQTHTTSAESVHIAVEVGNDIGQHVAFTRESRLYDKTIELMLERGYYCGTQWAPLTEQQLATLERRDFPGDDRFNGMEGYDYELENSIRLIEAGVPQFVSTDSIVFDPDVADDADWGGLGGHKSISGDAQFLVMQSMSQRGMTNMQIIEAATINPAKAYQVDTEIGTLEAGKIADIVVVGSDPLEDIANLRDVRKVMKNGQFVDVDALPSAPVLTSEAARQPGAIRRRDPRD